MMSYKYTKTKNTLSDKYYFDIEIPDTITLKVPNTLKEKKAEYTFLTISGTTKIDHLSTKDIDSIVDYEAKKFIANREAMIQAEIDEKQQKIAQLQAELEILQA